MLYQRQIEEINERLSKAGKTLSGRELEYELFYISNMAIIVYD